MAKDLQIMLLLSWVISVLTAFSAGNLYPQYPWQSALIGIPFLLGVLYMHWIPVKAATRHMKWVAEHRVKEWNEIKTLRSKVEEYERHERGTQN